MKLFFDACSAFRVEYSSTAISFIAIYFGIISSIQLLLLDRYNFKRALIILFIGAYFEIFLVALHYKRPRFPTPNQEFQIPVHVSPLELQQWVFDEASLSL